MIDAQTRECAGKVFQRFEALPVEADGSVRVPCKLHRDLIDLALDVLAGPESKAKRGAPAMLRMLVRLPVVHRRSGP
jgi:hypothetical protein